METFRRSPGGVNPSRQSLASSRKRVLRGGGAIHPAKRRQRELKLCDGASKVSRRSLRRCVNGGSTEGSQWARCGGPAGVEEQGKGSGVPQERGRSCHFHGRIPARTTGLPSPGSAGGARPVESERNGCEPWRRQAKPCEGRREGWQEDTAPS